MKESIEEGDGAGNRKNITMKIKEKGKKERMINENKTKKTEFCDSDFDLWKMKNI